MKRFAFIFAALSAFSVHATTLPEEATITIRPFTFSEEALSGLENEAKENARLFRNHIVLASQKAGFIVTKDKSHDKEDEEVETVEEVPSEVAKEEAIVEGDNESAKEEKDDLMKAVEKAEKTEVQKEGEEKTEKESDKAVKAQKPKKVTYVMTGYVTEYENEVGKPVNVGNTQRKKLSVTFSANFKVKDSLGKTVLSDKVSISSTSSVSQIVDTERALDALNKKAFQEAARQIVQKISGQSDEKEEEMSDEDYYNDSPGKRLKGQSAAKKTSTKVAKKSTSSENVIAKYTQKQPKKNVTKPSSSDGPVTFERDGKVVTKWTIH